MEPPEEPSIEDCCHSGCNPCIFDVYERQLKLYEKYITEKNKLPRLKSENGISELKNTHFKIVRTQLLCDCLKILTFKIICPGAKTWWNPGDHFLYKYSSQNVTCTRAYSPIKLKSQINEDFDFSIVVKCYDNGLVSKHLFELEVGDITLWRGPYGSYTIKPNTFKIIVMIAQGTGIAPFMSIIENILCNEDDMTKIILYYCCQSTDEILFRDELYLYKGYWNFSYEIFLNCAACNINFKYQEPINKRRFSNEDLNKLKPYLNNQFLLCGSSDFMKNYNDVLVNENVIAENIILF